MPKHPRSPQKQPTKQLPTTVHATLEASAWVPDPMQLAQLAGQLYLGRNAPPATPHEALQQAWAFFADSVALCVELRRASPRELRDMYGNTRSIVHSGKVLRMIERSGPPPKTLRFYPQRQESDPARAFFGVKTARTIADNIKEYCLAHQEEDNGCPYDNILKDSEGVEEGETYHDLPLEFLEKIKEFKHERKVEGGHRNERPQRAPPLRIVVPDDYAGEA